MLPAADWVALMKALECRAAYQAGLEAVRNHREPPGANDAGAWLAVLLVSQADWAHDARAWLRRQTLGRIGL